MSAKAIHYGRSEFGDLVPLACAVLETNLLRSTLRALALKSAVTAKETLGTLLLGDVDCMPPEAQADLSELLRADSLKMRVIATAGRSLTTPISEGKFSLELACTLSTITIELPPLAERIEDLPLLAQAFLEEINAGATKQVGGFSPEALDRLSSTPGPAMSTSWPKSCDSRTSGHKGAKSRRGTCPIRSNGPPTLLRIRRATTKQSCWRSFWLAWRRN